MVSEFLKIMKKLGLIVVSGVYVGISLTAIRGMKKQNTAQTREILNLILTPRRCTIEIENEI